jgi:hypothetical protein
MKLGEAQRLFASRVPRLIDKVYDMGYECSIGDVFRDPRSHGKFGDFKAYGRPESAHKLKLAIDLNLFKDGRYLRDTEAHRPFGEYWKGLDPENHRWGGDFDEPDGNHYSFTIWGVA